MPHVVVKLLDGRSDQQKTRLAEQIVKGVTATLNCSEDSVSVAIEDIKPGDRRTPTARSTIAARISAR